VRTFTPDNAFVLRVTTVMLATETRQATQCRRRSRQVRGRILLAGGHAVRARWSKSDASSPLALTDTAGDELRVPPGRTWIELVPRSVDVTVS
jgi:hypothetical protein